MDYPLISAIVSISEQNPPIRWQGGDIDSKPMVLGGDEASLTVAMDTRLVVATVAIPTGLGSEYRR